MARGGYRPGAGRPKGAKSKAAPKDDLKKKQGALDLGDEQDDGADAEGKLEPLDYMLEIMRDKKMAPELRARMAVAAAPFIHTRRGEEKPKGKKEEKGDRAKDVGSGKFAAGAPPKLKVVNK